MRVKLNLLLEDCELLLESIKTKEECKDLFNKINSSYRNFISRQQVPIKAKIIKQDIPKNIEITHTVNVGNADKNTREKARKFREELIINQTQPEKVTKAVLNLLKIKFEFQKIFYTSTKFYIVDFFLKDYGIVIEIDGQFHYDDNHTIKDAERTGLLRLHNNIKYLGRIPNKDTQDHVGLANKIKAIIDVVSK